MTVFVACDVNSSAPPPPPSECNLSARRFTLDSADDDEELKSGVVPLDDELADGVVVVDAENFEDWVVEPPTTTFLDDGRADL